MQKPFQRFMLTILSQSSPCLSSALACRRREVLSSQDNISVTCDLNYKGAACAPCPVAKLVSIRWALQLALSLLITKSSLFLQEGTAVPAAPPPPCCLPKGFSSQSLPCSLPRLVENFSRALIQGGKCPFHQEIGEKLVLFLKVLEARLEQPGLEQGVPALVWVRSPLNVPPSPNCPVILNNRKKVKTQR